MNTPTAVRRTKIVATLGPATDADGVLVDLIRSGLDVARVNLSHGTADEHRARVAALRAAAEEVGTEVGLLVDLQGPKIRIGRFAEGAIELAEGARFTLDGNCPLAAGNVERVGFTYAGLPDDVGPDDQLLLDDGRITMVVDEVDGRQIHCHVVIGGQLSDSKGINRLGGGLSVAALSDKDRGDIIIAAELEADYLAISFPRSAYDVHEARRLLEAAGGSARIISKIERAEAVADAAAIIEASDAIMVARGDLGVEIGEAALPGVQKRLIRMANERDRAVITATQMMQSMVERPVPTRAEVLDVANAVLDGTDAVMLSEETAVGRHPALVVATMARVCVGAESQRDGNMSRARREDHFERIDESIAMATMYTANRLPVRAIAALTESGDTTLWMSRIGSDIPIYALTPHREAARRVTLYRGVYPVHFDPEDREHAAVTRAALVLLASLEVVDDGDLVVITQGDRSGVHGGTNEMKILRVGDNLAPTSQVMPGER